MAWATVEAALVAFKRGDFVLVMDNEDRENECDLIVAAETCTAEQMAFMIRYSTGIVCVAAERARLEHFGLHPATGSNTDRNATNFYVSTDYLPGTSTGVCAHDRAATVRAMCDLSNPAEAFSKPGHMFPLCPRAGGVLERPGHTESTFDLCRLSGVTPVGVLAELMHDDGTMYRRDDSLEFGRRHGIPAITVAQLIEYRRKHAPAATTTEQLLASNTERATLQAAAVAASRASGRPHDADQAQLTSVKALSRL